MGKTMVEGRIGLFSSGHQTQLKALQATIRFRMVVFHQGNTESTTLNVRTIICTAT